MNLKHTSLILAAVALMIGLPLQAENPASRDLRDHPPASTTKLEAFLAKPGIVLIRGYSTLGQITSESGSVRVDASEFSDAGNPNGPRITGVSITVKEARTEKESTSYIDSDEIDSLVRGIENIRHVTKNVTRLDLFEADYRTKGDFRISVFSNSKADILATISSGQAPRAEAYFHLSDLDKLRELVLLANFRSLSK